MDALDFVEVDQYWGGGYTIYSERLTSWLVIIVTYPSQPTSDIDRPLVTWECGNGKERKGKERRRKGKERKAQNRCLFIDSSSFYLFAER